MSINPGGSQLNIASGIREFATASPQVIAIIDGDRSLTYAFLYERACKLSNLLLDSQLKPGSPVAVLIGNRLEYSEVAAGCAMAGLPIVPINPRQTAEETGYILSHSRAQALIYDVALTALLPQNLPDLVWVLDGSDSRTNYE